MVASGGWYGRPRSHHERVAFYGWPGGLPHSRPTLPAPYAYALSRLCIPFPKASDQDNRWRAMVDHTDRVCEEAGWTRACYQTPVTPYHGIFGSSHPSPHCHQLVNHLAHLFVTPVHHPHTMACACARACACVHRDPPMEKGTAGNTKTETDRQPTAGILQGLLVPPRVRGVVWAGMPH